MSKTHLTDFDILADPTLEAVLSILVLYGISSKTALLSALHNIDFKTTPTRRINMQELLEAIDTLKKVKWVKSSASGYFVDVEHENKILLHMLSKQDDCRYFERLAQIKTCTRSSLWLAIIKGDCESLIRILPLWMMMQNRMDAQPAYSLCRNEAGQQVMAKLHYDVQSMLLSLALEAANEGFFECSAIYRYARLHFETKYAQFPHLLEEVGIQAILRGEDVLQGPMFPDGRYPVAVVWYSALLRGDKDRTLTIFENYIKHYRSVTRKRKLEFTPFYTMLSILTLIGSGDVSRYSVLRSFIKYGLRSNFGSAYGLFDSLLDELEGKGKTNPAPALSESLSGIAGLLLALSKFWDGETESSQWQSELETFRDRLGSIGYVTLQHEIDAVLQSQFNTEPLDDSWFQRQGRKPLHTLYKRKEAWQYALSALTQIKSGAVESGGRLAWFITLNRGHISLEPREQKRSGNGIWSKGRPIALKRLSKSPESFDYLLDQDRQALRHIQYNPNHYYYGGNTYELDGELALPALVGHPALFWNDAPDARIDLAQGQVALQLKAAKGYVELKLTPEKITSESRIVFEKETPTRVTVYSINDEVQKIAAIVGQSLRVPEHAKEQLVQAITSIAPLLPVHTDLPELSSHIVSVPADKKLYAHLLPLDEGIRLQVLVRPLANGGWYPPGHGSTAVMGEQDGQPVQTVRQLKTELTDLKRVLTGCPALNEAESDGREWQLTDPQLALEVLSQLRALDASLLECVWPEGERMRIKGKRSLNSMRLGLKQQGDWFVLSGELELDDGQVLQLKQLLQLFQESRGRFVKLGSQDWIALDDTLRKRLEQLSLLGDITDKNGIRVNALMAPFLADLASEAGVFEGDSAWAEQLTKLNSLNGWSPKVPSTLQTELRDYQLEGYIWLSRLARWGVGACLADDMGLGKTIQTLALLIERASGGPQLVVAPTSVTMNWLSEIERFAPTLNVRPYHHQRNLSDLAAFDLVVVSYGLLQQDSEIFTSQHWHSIVLDEAQAIKNANTKRSQTVMALQADFKLAVSGTPIENHLGELWNLFRFLNPGLLGSQERFNERFALPIERGENTAKKALKMLIQPFLLRRSKNQVLDELPPRTEITHKISLSPGERHWYEALRQQAVETLTETKHKPLQVLAEITKLRRFCCHPSLVLNDAEISSSKLVACIEIIEELLSNQHKVLIYSQFVDHLSIVRHRLTELEISYQYLDGSTPMLERKKRVDAFQNGEMDVFLISLKAGGTGLNLTAADYIIHLDPWWNPAVEDQASDRAHRMGQKRPVTVYRLVTENTIEEQIVALHAKKRDLADSLLEGGEVSGKLDADALLDLLRGGLAC